MNHILFINPNQKLASIYQRHLSPYFPVDSAQDGLSALRMMKAKPPRMIISEHELPFLSGIALLKFVRSHPEMFAVPFMFLTDSQMPDEALGLGSTAWLNQKDYGPEELLRHIYQHHRQFYF